MEITAKLHKPVGLGFKRTAKLVKTDKEWMGQTGTSRDLKLRPALILLYQNIAVTEEQSFLTEQTFKYPVAGRSSNESIGKHKKKGN